MPGAGNLGALFPPGRLPQAPPSNPQFRAFQTRLDATGYGVAEIRVDNTAMEWVIRQITPSTTRNGYVMATFFYNNFRLHATPDGAYDTLVGPPYLILRPGEVAEMRWDWGVPGALATAAVLYEEIPVGKGSMV